MALAAVGREAPGAMIGSSGFCEFFRVTAVAVRRKAEAVELPYGSHLVAGITVRYRVSADKWKPILVLVNVVDRNLPAVGVVT